jgi:hypothetical protein
MNDKTELISATCKRRLHVQGYQNYSDKELNDYKHGIRFAYGLCITLVAVGLIFNSVPVLLFTALIALVGAFLPNHPFDYLYNYGVRQLLNKPKLPPRSNQGRFACGIAAVWLTVTIYLLYNDYVIAGNIFGALLFAVGALVTTTDICIPSMIYNAIFKKSRIR